MILNSKLNDISQKMMWEEAVHMYEHVQNIMVTTVRRRSHLKFSMEKNPRSLVSSQSLDVLRTSQRGKILRDRRRKRRTNKSWLDILKTIKETHTS